MIPQPPTQKSKTEIAVTVFVAAIAIYVVAFWRPTPRLPEAQPHSSQDSIAKAPVLAGPPAEALEEWYAIGHLIGPEDAPVRIVEFGSFRCGFCADLYFAVDSIQRRYPNMVSLRWIHRVTGDAGTEGSDRYVALASECAADQGAFEGFYHQYFGGSFGTGTRGDAAYLASKSGVKSLNRFRACLDARRHDRTVDRHNAAGAKMGFNGTPAWFLNSQLILGAVTTAQLDSLVLSILRPTAAKKL